MSDAPRNSPSVPNPDLYSPANLRYRYDPLIIGLSHRLLWGVSNRVLRGQYAANIGVRHLDVGPGSGYFLATLPTDTPLRELHLLDLNEAPLERTSARLQARFGPSHSHVADALAVFAPWPLESDSVDSVGSSMMLHTLPRASIGAKAAVFDQAARVLVPGGRFFGSTILGEGGNRLGARALAIYHKKDNWFSCMGDTVADLRLELMKRFDKVNVAVHGRTGVWEAQAR